MNKNVFSAFSNILRLAAAAAAVFETSVVQAFKTYKYRAAGQCKKVRKITSARECFARLGRNLK